MACKDDERARNDPKWAESQQYKRVPDPFDKPLAGGAGGGIPPPYSIGSAVPGEDSPSYSSSPYLVEESQLNQKQIVTGLVVAGALLCTLKPVQKAVGQAAVNLIKRDGVLDRIFGFSRP